MVMRQNQFDKTGIGLGEVHQGQQSEPQEIRYNPWGQVLGDEHNCWEVPGGGRSNSRDGVDLVLQKPCLSIYYACAYLCSELASLTFVSHLLPKSARQLPNLHRNPKASRIWRSDGIILTDSHSVKNRGLHVVKLPGLVVEPISHITLIKITSWRVFLSSIHTDTHTNLPMIQISVQSTFLFDWPFYWVQPETEYIFDSHNSQTW